MKRFKVVVCPECGNVQATESETAVKCFHCGKSTMLRKIKILRTFDSGRESALFVQEYNRVKAEGNENRFLTSRAK